MTGSYPKVFSTETNQWTNLLDENFTIDAIGGITSASPQADDIFRYVAASSEYINAPITTVIQNKNLTLGTINASTITASSGSVSGAIVASSGSISGNLVVGSTLTVGGVLVTGGGGGSGSVSTEQIQDGAAPLLDHAFHTNITASYDDANNRVLLSTVANPTTEDIQDAAAPLLNHAFHTNLTASYDDANNRVLLVSTASAASITTEQIQDAAAPLFDHAFHTRLTATYDDANNRVLLTANLPTGASAQSNFYDVVRDYGVVAGEANSATKINNALIAARDAGGGIVYIPSGTYNIGSTLEIFSGTTLLLNPRAVMFRTTASIPMLANGASGATYSGYNGQGNIRIVGGIWESRGQAFPINPGMCMSIGHATDIIIQDCFISNVGGFHAIEINSSKNVRIQNVRFQGFVNTGSRSYSEAIQIDTAISSAVFGYFGAYDNTPCEDVIVQGCYFGASGTSGTTAWPTGIGTHSYVAGVYHKHCKFINNTFEGLTEYAIRTYNNYNNLLIEGNIIKNCFGGIAVGPDAPVNYAEPSGPNMLLFADGQTSFNINIISNLIDSAGNGGGTNGIWIIDAENVTISNNRVIGISRLGSNLADGILCVKLVHGIISGNYLKDIGDDGIDIRSNSLNVLITNNLTVNVSRTTNNTYRHIYIVDGSEYSVLLNRGYRTGGNTIRAGIEIFSGVTNTRYFGNYYGPSATSPVIDAGTGSNTSTVNA